MRAKSWWILAGTLIAAVVYAMNSYFDPAKPHHAREGFRNNYSNAERASFWKWQWERWQKGLPKVPDGGWHFPVDVPDVAFLKSNRTEFTATWIGHSTVLLQIGGVNILTDPIFSERASPVSFAGPKRVVPPAPDIEHLPHIDIVLISHNHYDHLDLPSVEQLARQPGGPPRFYVPLGLERWFSNLGIVADEMDWWDSRNDAGLVVHFAPAQHWSARTLWDRNETLWGSFVIEHPRFRVMFTGDTGYSQDFADIQRRFQSFDLAVIPIGAYAPRWFMAAQHVDPEEAVRIHRDLHARQSLAVHWGTFVLTDEPMDEPPQRLAQALRDADLPPDAFMVLHAGETRRLLPLD
jgi:L-ascorbate metabolism protein UlaG (beta-lactamase superfamily)